jgi:hypothetical protein
VNQAICEAVHQARVISASYHERKRHLEPHCHGLSAAGRELVLAFDRDAESPGCKAFAVEELANLHVLDESFSSRPDFAGRIPRSIRTVHCSTP